MNQQTFDQLQETLNNLKQTNIITVPSEVRINLWEILLGIVTEENNYDLHHEQKNEIEINYHKLKTNSQMKLNKQNPLDLGAAMFSVSYKKLKMNIEKDIFRTYQEYVIFHSREIQEKMTNVLLVWGLLNPTVSYRQGMNEVVGLVIHADPNITEATLFQIFDAIMNKLGHKDAYDYSKKKLSIKDNPLLKRILNIYNYLLRNHNLDLFRFLSLAEFQPEVFMIRWVKCLLSREFEVSQSLIIWDHLFKDFFQSRQSGLELLDYMIITMIDMSQERLYEEESSFEMIRFLLNYPTDSIDVINFIAQSQKIQSSQIKNIQYKERISDTKSNATSNFMDPTQTLSSIEPRERLKARDGCSFNIVDMSQYFNFYTAPVKLFFLLSKSFKNQSNQKELSEVLKK